MADNTIKIGGELESMATGKIVAAASAIKDKSRNKTQDVINEDVQQALDELATVSPNREYDEEDPNGYGYIVLTSDKTFQQQVTMENTIYEVRYDYDLDGDTFDMPDNCMLNFSGGKIDNGTIVGHGLSISKKSGTVQYTGKYNFASIMYAEEYFNESNARGLAALQSVIDMKPFNSDETTVIYFASGRLYDWTGSLN